MQASNTAAAARALFVFQAGVLVVGSVVIAALTMPFPSLFLL
jgi:hypothetical protein